MTQWSPQRILVAVDDSRAALAAARLAVDLAAQTGAHLKFVHAISDGVLVETLARLGHDAEVGERISHAALSLLNHVASRARDAGVEADTVCVEGSAASVVLAQARDWPADVIVIGRSNVHGIGQPYLGDVTREVLEFSDHPVLVIPHKD